MTRDIGNVLVSDDWRLWTQWLSFVLERVPPIPANLHLIYNPILGAEMAMFHLAFYKSDFAYTQEDKLASEKLHLH